MFLVKDLVEAHACSRFVKEAPPWMSLNQFARSIGVPERGGDMLAPSAPSAYLTEDWTPRYTGNVIADMHPEEDQRVHQQAA